MNILVFYDQGKVLGDEVSFQSEVRGGTLYLESGKSLESHGSLSFSCHLELQERVEDVGDVEPVEIEVKDGTGVKESSQ